MMLILQWIRRKFSSGDSLNLSGINAYKLTHDVYVDLKLRKYNKARELLLRAIKFRDVIEDPAIVRFLLRSLEATWLLPGAYEEAISFFSEYINRYPQDSDAYQGRAAALWYAGKLQDAIQEYSHALELKPNDILSLCGRGQVLAEIGEGRKALDDLNLALEAIKEAPEAGPIWEEWHRQIEAFVRNGRVVALAGLGEQS